VAAGENKMNEQRSKVANFSVAGQEKLPIVTTAGRRLDNGGCVPACRSDRWLQKHFAEHQG
jgi:hypothetical protein